MALACPQLVFNRTILMGDASFVIRPHTAVSTSKGIANAFALVGELVGKQELSDRSIIGKRSFDKLMDLAQGAAANALGKPESEWLMNGRDVE